jgi:serine protease Do
MQTYSVQEARPLRRLGLGVAAASVLVWSGVAQAATPPESFSALAKKVTPAVVNVLSTHEVDSEQTAMPEMPFSFPEGSPFEKFFRQFGGPGQGGNGQKHKAMGLGSGFIIDADGYIVTNNHVVKDATEVKVRLDDDEIFPAKVIGTDKQTDLALLKIDAKRKLPMVSFGDSDKAEVGDWVMAVGNPFGLGGTVTAGIVSARGRNIQSGPYDDFLQVDASINKGNSGGPLFNLEGTVIGINSAIYSPNGGNVGIGFAIPSNLAKSVIAQLRENGKVERGWLGVQIQLVSPEIASAIGLDKPHGAIVSGVMKDSPAEKAGLKSGDVITAVDKSTVGEPRDLARLVAEKPAGSRIALAVWRDHDSMTLTVVTGDQPAQVAMSDENTNADGSYHSPMLGAQLGELTGELRQQLGADDSVSGVVVLDVDADGAAAEHGLRPGDIIRKIGSRAVKQPQEIDAVVEKAKEAPNKAVLMLVRREGRDLFLGFSVS